MQKRLFVVSALIAVGYLTCTLALAQTAEKPAETAKKPPDPAKKRSEAAKKLPTLASRTAICTKDCSTGNVHGAYRAYNTSDPNLKSPEGQKMYAECVRLCLAPLPSFHIWKVFLD